MLNELLNKAFKTSNKSYDHGKDNIQLCQKYFTDLAKDNDDITLRVYLYFFPVTSLMEENSEEFWFTKYKDEKKYDEYDFAVDLLANYVQYLSDKDKQKFQKEIEIIIPKFEEYKLFSYYYSIIHGYQDILIATVAYFTKDTAYYRDSLDAYVSGENIQTFLFLIHVKDKIYEKNKKKNDQDLKEDIMSEINDLRDLIDKLANDGSNMDIEIQNLKGQIKNLNNQFFNNNNRILNMENKITNMKDEIVSLKGIIKNEREEREEYQKKAEEEKKDFVKEIQDLKAEIKEHNIKFDEINLRDTIKMYFRYLYKMLKSLFEKELDDAYNFWGQIKAIKVLLKKPLFKKYFFLSEFIEDLENASLTSLNFAAPDPKLKVRKIEDIKKYLQENSKNMNYDKVVKFFKGLPRVNEFINLNSLYFVNPEKADQEFEKLITFPQAAGQVFTDLF